MSRDVIKFPIISGALIVWYLLFGYVTNNVIIPKSAVGSDVPARTASFLNATLAPGLSSFTFINEFGGPGAAGLGSLMDVSVQTNLSTLAYLRLLLSIASSACKFISLRLCCPLCCRAKPGVCACVCV